MKKKYVFNVSQSVSVPVEIIAESREEAEKKIQKMIDDDELFFHPQEPEYDFDLEWEHELSDLDRAIELIETYFRTKLDESDCVEREELNNVSVAYTTFEDEPDRFGDNEMHEVQVSVDLVNPALIFCQDGKEIHRDTYETIDALIDAELSWLDFDELTTRWPE